MPSDYCMILMPHRPKNLGTQRPLRRTHHHLETQPHLHIIWPCLHLRNGKESVNRLRLLPPGPPFWLIIEIVPPS